MYCSKCGSQVLATDKYCSFCGALISNTDYTDYSNNFQNSNYYTDNSDTTLENIFIGENYEAIRKKNFSFPAMFFGLLYFLYRKFYSGFFLFLVVNVLVLGLIPELAFIIPFVFGFLFNKLYLKFVEYKVNKIKSQFIGTNEELRARLIKKGGTSWLGPIIYIVFSVLLSFIIMVIFFLIIFNINVSGENPIENDFTFEPQIVFKI